MTPEQVASLADELERMLQHTADMEEQRDASASDLLSDMEDRLELIINRLRGRVDTVETWEPHHYHYPMAEES